MTVSEVTDGLLRIAIELESKNPKDPPLNTQALFDTGANCNILNKKFEYWIHESNCFLGQSQKRIKFANKSTSELCANVRLSFDIEHHGIRCQFEADFLVCEIAEEVIFGRNLLDETGLLHLIITDKTSPNPFEIVDTVSQLAIDHLDDKDGEGEDVELTECIEPAFSEDTCDLWAGESMRSCPPALRHQFV